MSSEPQLWSVLTRASQDLAADSGLPAPADLFRAGRRRRARRRVAAVVGSVVCVLVLIMGAAASQPAASTGPAGVANSLVDRAARLVREPQPAYAGLQPELGLVPGPLDVTASDRAKAGHPDSAHMVGLLAQVDTGAGVMAVFDAGGGLRGGRCVQTALRPPAYNQGSGTDCGSAGGVPLADRDIDVAGDGAYCDRPATVHGGAPRGTRRMRLTGPDRPSVSVPANDGGAAFKHRAYWIAVWDLMASDTTVTAYNAKGEVLATRHLQQEKQFGFNACPNAG